MQLLPPKLRLTASVATLLLLLRLLTIAAQSRHHWHASGDGVVTLQADYQEREGSERRPLRGGSFGAQWRCLLGAHNGGRRSGV
jgi:hypothetical protein